MDITPTITNTDPTRAEVEQVQQQQQEYHLIGSFMRTRGLKLYVYSLENDTITEIKPEVKTTIATALDPITGLLIINDKESKEKCLIDSRNIPFEALNKQNAEKRIAKWKRGNIVQICNLTPTSAKRKII